MRRSHSQYVTTRSLLCIVVTKLIALVSNEEATGP